MPKKGKPQKQETTWANIFTLILILLVADLAVMFALPLIIPHAGLDYFDFSYYYTACQNIFSGRLPYINFSFDYPPLALIPMIVAYLPSYLFGVPGLFILCFSMEMFLCNAGIVTLIYLIAKKVRDDRLAFCASLMYICAISAQYFLMLRYDAFPTFLMLLAIWFVMENDRTSGYLTAVFGFLVKLFPCIAIPVFAARSDDILLELEEHRNYIVAAAILFLITVAAFGNEIINYISASLVRNYFVASSFVYMVSQITGAGLNYTSITFIVLVFALAALVYYALKIRESKSELEINTLTLKAILAIVVLFSISQKYISPQYQIWYVPIICILLAGDIIGMLLFFAFEVVCYIEFPLTFGTWYANTGYLAWEALPLFLVKYALMIGIVIYCCVGNAPESKH